MARLDPTTWIDEQRAAGMGRGNIYRDILREAAIRRGERSGYSQEWIDRRVARVETIKQEAASDDAQVDVVQREPEVPSFAAMVDRWNQV